MASARKELSENASFVLNQNFLYKTAANANLLLQLAWKMSKKSKEPIMTIRNLGKG